MELDTLDGSSWDVVISGTSLPQCLLALALSRSGKKILHVDRNAYYGGDEAALSLAEAEAWAERHATDDSSKRFSHAKITKPEETIEAKLASSRAYSLALAPQIIYARAGLLEALISSQAHTQIDFQAVGSWFIVNTNDVGSGDEQSAAQLVRVPGGREDIFQDNSLSLKAKRSLVKFLRYVTTLDTESEDLRHDKELLFTEFLEQKFSLPAASHAPLFALTLDLSPVDHTTAGSAVPKIARHLRSIGVFGPGFGALVPKWGGLAEITQVACRAGAVGGGVYVLGKGIDGVQAIEEDSIGLSLNGGESVKTSWFVGQQEDLPAGIFQEIAAGHTAQASCRSITIVSSPLSTLFPPTSEGGVTPVGAVVVVPPISPHDSPVYILVHSGDSGECPASQSVLYASTEAGAEDANFDRITAAVHGLLDSLAAQTARPQILWSLQYLQRSPSVPPTRSNRALALAPLSMDLALQDSVLEDIKAAWLRIMGVEAEADRFLVFGSRDDEAVENADDQVE